MRIASFLALALAVSSACGKPTWTGLVRLLKTEIHHQPDAADSIKHETVDQSSEVAAFKELTALAPKMAFKAKALKNLEQQNLRHFWPWVYAEFLNAEDYTKIAEIYVSIISIISGETDYDVSFAAFCEFFEPIVTTRVANTLLVPLKDGQIDEEDNAFGASPAKNVERYFDEVRLLASKNWMDVDTTKNTKRMPKSAADLEMLYSRYIMFISLGVVKGLPEFPVQMLGTPEIDLHFDNAAAGSYAVLGSMKTHFTDLQGTSLYGLAISITFVQFFRRPILRLLPAGH